VSPYVKVIHDNIIIAYDLLSSETHAATIHILKIDIATSCDDLIERIKQENNRKVK
jgi:hypothetical protein